MRTFQGTYALRTTLKTCAFLCTVNEILCVKGTVKDRYIFWCAAGIKWARTSTRMWRSCGRRWGWRPMRLWIWTCPPCSSCCLNGRAGDFLRSSWRDTLMTFFQLSEGRPAWYISVQNMAVILVCLCEGIQLGEPQVSQRLSGMKMRTVWPLSSVRNTNK